MNIATWHGLWKPRPAWRKHIRNLHLLSAAAVAALVLGCGSASAPVTSPPTPTPVPAGPIGIQPADVVVTSPMSGYFPDPYPIHFTPGSAAAASRFFSGTRQELLSCTGTLAAECFQTQPITVDFSSFSAQATAGGATLSSIENNNIYQDDSGAWQMATTLNLTDPAGDTWSAIAHAHATGAATPVPTAWQVDTLLIGSLSAPAKANYDGKYFEDSGNLYLLYSMALTTNPLHDGVVAQLMQSATQLAAAPPVTLLGPTVTNGGYNSEYFFGLNPSAPFKLVETGNITVIDGIYVMAYSTGAYDLPDYKAGVAYSDTFLPAAGQIYQKVLKLDTAGVWGQPGSDEVQYLLQTQESEWPNYVATQVISPGVPSVIQDPSGTYYLYFAGYNPSDAPIDPSTGDYNGSHRRPYFLQLDVAIPAGATVAGTTNAALANWITAVTQ